jgi:hypothetical protein
MPGVFPDYLAPVVRNAGTEREWFGYISKELRKNAPHWSRGIFLLGHSFWLRRRARTVGSSLVYGRTGRTGC